MSQSSLRRLVRTVPAESPAFVCYLLALGALPFRWLSPIGAIQGHGQWTDVLIGVAAILWAAERVRERAFVRSLRTWQLPLVVYVGLACVSAKLAVPGRGGGWSTVVVVAELAVLAVLTADLAAAPDKRRMIARVIVVSSIVTVALAIVGEIAFYAGARTGLLGGYGEQLSPSRLYARVQAGFESAPLLGSFCIFASGIVASDDAALSRRLRIGAQVSLGLLCVATISRACVGFLLAAVLRRAAAMHGRRRVLIPVAATVISIGFLTMLTVGRLQADPGKPSVSYVVPDPGNRREAFVTSLHTLQYHPAFGIGPGALPGINHGQPFRPHFTPLNIAATLGLPALAAFSAMLWLIWRTRRRPTDIALWSALAGIGLDGLVQDADHFRHLWILLGLLGSNRSHQVVAEDLRARLDPA
jgi:hypothetical protein